MYFKNFPSLYYGFDINNVDTLKVVTDITANVRFRTSIFDAITLYDEYDIQEGDTPEIIAAKYYGSSEYHWVIMLANQRYDYVNDFPKPYYALERYIVGKYNDFKATGWSFDGTTITITVPNHSINEGDDVNVSGATSTTNAPNGLFTVTAVTSDTISFDVESAPTGTPAGYVLVQTTNKQYDVHHYINSNGLIVSSDVVGALPVTNYEYEESVNDSKRRIKLISPQLLNTILDEFKTLV